MLAFPNDLESVVKTQIANQVRNSSGYAKRAAKDKRKCDLSSKFTNMPSLQSCSSQVGSQVVEDELKDLFANSSNGEETDVEKEEESQQFQTE